MNDILITLRLTLLVASVFLSACSPEPTDSVSPEPVSTNSLATDTSNEISSPPNILLIIADDMGVEALTMYGLAETGPTTASMQGEGPSDGPLYLRKPSLS